MKPVEYLYFNIYNHFYQRAYSSQEFYVRIQAMYLFSLSIGAWILLFEAIYLRIFRHSWFSSKSGSVIFATTVYLGIALLCNYIFIVNERDRKIYGKYEEVWDNNPRKKRDLMISFFVVVAPFICFALLSFFFPRHK